MSVVAFVDEMLWDTVPLFVDSQRSFSKKLDELLSNDLDEQTFSLIRTIGHKMKGAGKSYGLVPLTRIGERVEFLASSRSGVEELRYLAAELRNLLQSVRFEVDPSTVTQWS